MLWPCSDLARETLGRAEDITSSQRGLQMIRRYVAGVTALPAFIERFGAVEVKVDGKVSSRSKKKIVIATGHRGTISINPAERKYWYTWQHAESTVARLAGVASAKTAAYFREVMDRRDPGEGIELLASKLEALVLHELSHALLTTGNDDEDAWYHAHYRLASGYRLLAEVTTPGHGPVFVEHYAFLLNLLAGKDTPGELLKGRLALEDLQDLTVLQTSVKKLVEDAAAATFPPDGAA